jgi:hypothetical protein
VEDLANRRGFNRRQCAIAARIQFLRQPPMLCSIHSISSGGATLSAPLTELPQHFKLLLSDDGEIFRSCRVIWQSGLQFGVEFANGPGSCKPV